MIGRYTHNAYDHAMRDVKREDRQMVGEVLDAMHDREVLGLDASVCARAVWQWLADEYDDTVAEHFAEWMRS